MEYLNINTKTNRILNVKDSLLESEKDFKELEKREIENTGIETIKALEELISKPINKFINEMDKFEKKK